LVETRQPDGLIAKRANRAAGNQPRREKANGLIQLAAQPKLNARKAWPNAKPDPSE
tara:strand:- start:414 stop:581 length:168 start_codon:yes stop_codon:yes gene_type:complete